jgi:hypothetical protein
MIMTSNRVEMLVNKTYDSIDVGGLYFLHPKKKQRLVSKKGLVTGIKDIVVSTFVFASSVLTTHAREKLAPSYSANGFFFC